MGKRTSYEPGTFCWVDLATTDTEGAKAFYGELFGWKAEDVPAGEEFVYTMMHLDGDTVCGLYEKGDERRSQGVPPYWLSYISVEDAEEAAEKAKRLGGTVIDEHDDDTGLMSTISDPGGPIVALYQPKEHIGANRVNDPGCLTWNELNTREPESASEFYSGLFGWELEPIEEDGKLVYATIRNNGWMNGGVMPMTEQHGDSPSFWLPYFTVRSCDEAATRVRDLGGAVLVEPFEPGAGRISVMNDPQGAVFAVFEGETDD